MLKIRSALPTDFPAIWGIFQPIVAAGDTYAYGPDMTADEARGIWMKPPAEPFVVDEDGRIVGTYSLRPNQPGLGNHVANCAYMTHPAARRRGIAARMCEHSLTIARERGFTAMQFNFVVASNEQAVRLWKKHGFAVVGEVPGAFRHRVRGAIAVLIMHRML
jgi:GNAT superfamily N-acetyltransferase